MVSTGIEGLESRRLAVAAERNLLDARLRVLEPSLAMAPQPVAFLVQLDRAVERRLALFKRAHDLLEALKRRLEAQLFDVAGLGIGHGVKFGPRCSSNQANCYSIGRLVNGSRIPGTTSSRSASSPASASAASASRACCSRSRRSSSISASRSPSNRVSTGAA